MKFLPVSSIPELNYRSQHDFMLHYISAPFSLLPAAPHPLSVSFTSALTSHESYLAKKQKEGNHTAVQHEYFICVWITIFSKDSLFSV